MCYEWICYSPDQLVWTAYKGLCINKQTHSALSWDYTLWGCQMLQFDWSICVTCVCIIRVSGIITDISQLTHTNYEQIAIITQIWYTVESYLQVSTTQIIWLLYQIWTKSTDTSLRGGKKYKIRLTILIKWSFIWKKSEQKVIKRAKKKMRTSKQAYQESISRKK